MTTGTKPLGVAQQSHLLGKAYTTPVETLEIDCQQGTLWRHQGTTMTSPDVTSPGLSHVPVHLKPKVFMPRQNLWKNLRKYFLRSRHREPWSGRTLPSGPPEWLAGWLSCFLSFFLAFFLCPFYDEMSFSLILPHPYYTYQRSNGSAFHIKSKHRMVTHKHNVAQLYRISRKDNSIREIYTERSQVQGKQENSRGIVPVRLTSSGTDAGGVPKPQPHHQR